MKLSYKTRNIQQFILIIIANLVLVSCGTYQSAYNDGIYNSDTNSQREKKVIIAGEREYKNYNNTYFTNELERLDNLNDEAIFTDVDTYSSPDSIYAEDDLNYNTNSSWGNNDNNDVVVHVNLINGSNWNDFGFGYNNFGWNNGGFNNWGPRGRWGWNNGFNNWGYNPFWNPYYNNYAFGQGFNNGFNNGFYNPYFGAFSNPYRFNNNSYYGNTRIGRRGTYNNTFRRGAVNSRNSSIISRSRTSLIKPTSSSTRRRRTSITKPTSFSTRRSIANTKPTRRSSLSTRNSSSNTSRNSNSTRRSISSRRNSLTRANSSTRRRGSSNTKGNSSSTRRNSTSSNTSYTSNRTSTPSRSSSSVRSSSSRSSGSSKGSSSSGRRNN